MVLKFEGSRKPVEASLGNTKAMRTHEYRHCCSWYNFAVLWAGEL
jgi:hypothetical protein